MKIKAMVTGFAVTLLVMSLIGGFGAFLRIYILKTPNLVDEHEIILREHDKLLRPEKYIDSEE